MQIALPGLAILAGLVLVAATVTAGDTTLSQAQRLYDSGNFSGAADLLAPVVRGGGNAKIGVLYGNCLERLTEEINTAAELRCYRGRGGSPTTQCMQDYAESMNAKYGAGAFEYNPHLVIIKYTGVHYGGAGSIAGDSAVAAEAAYNRLSKNLIGSPNEVLARINAYLNEYPKGEWHKKGLLLLARINEDIWWIHRKWSWLLYNWDMSPDDLIVRAEPYRQEAMRIFGKIRGGEEGKAAKRELKMLKDYESDGRMYGIINESSIEGVVVEPARR